MAQSIGTLQEELRAAKVAQRGRITPALNQFLDHVAILLNELKKKPVQDQPEPPLLSEPASPSQSELQAQIQTVLDDKSLTSRAKLAQGIEAVFDQE